MSLKRLFGTTAFSTHSYYNKGNYFLASLCDKYGSDKGSIKTEGHPYSWPPHSYTEHYSRIFDHCRMSIRRVFECGIGTNDPEAPSSMGENGIPGASLRVWQDYFPNAMIFGADIDKNILFNESRIRTYYVDQTNSESIATMWWQLCEDGWDCFDLIIDDGLHNFAAGSTLFTNSIEHLITSGIYIIEDVQEDDFPLYKEFFENMPYLVEYINMRRPDHNLLDNSLILVRK